MSFFLSFNHDIDFILVHTFRCLFSPVFQSFSLHFLVFDFISSTFCHVSYHVLLWISRRYFLSSLPPLSFPLFILKRVCLEQLVCYPCFYLADRMLMTCLVIFRGKSLSAFECVFKTASVSSTDKITRWHRVSSWCRDSRCGSWIETPNKKRRNPC